MTIICEQAAGDGWHVHRLSDGSAEWGECHDPHCICDGIVVYHGSVPSVAELASLASDCPDRA
jgi:hypothetical protein